MPSVERDLHVLHTGDLRGNLDATPYLATVARQSREQHPGALLLDTGGWARGNHHDSVSVAFQGKPMIEVMNEMAFDAAGVGEGDLSWGLAVLEQRAAEARFPILCANLRDASRRPLEHVRPRALIQRAGFQVGLIGLCCPQCERPGDTLVLEPTEAARAQVERLLADGADVLIVLSHLGEAADRRLAAALPVLTCILGGHDLADAAPPEQVGETVLARASHSAQSLGVLTLHLEQPVEAT